MDHSPEDGIRIGRVGCCHRPVLAVEDGVGQAPIQLFTGSGEYFCLNAFLMRVAAEKCEQPGRGRSNNLIEINCLTI